MTPAARAEVAERRGAVIADHDLSGRRLCRALAAVTDEWLAELYAAAVDGRPGLALLAVGGHGRGELAPGSDLDLLLLHERIDDVAGLVRALWYPIWDAGLKLGHSVRTPKEALRLAATDLATATAALHARHLAGDAAISERFVTAAGQQWRTRGSRWLGKLAKSITSRHGDAGEVAFLLEPDLKDGRGGLRDVQALRWAEAARPVLLDGDDGALGAGEDVLLEVRVALHRATGRAQDRLLMDHQDDVAEVLGWGSADDVVAALAAAARTVSWVSDDCWRRVGSVLAGPADRVFRPDRELGPGLVLRDGEVALTADAALASDRALVLRAAAAAARAGTVITRASLDRLAAEARPIGDPWPNSGRDALVDLLASGRAAIPVWEALDQRHLVERVLPEWAPVRSRPQRNPLHRFTVDRHLLETAANAAALTATVPRPDLLLVAALLHDLGKGQPGDHTDAGMRLMAGIAPRLGFDAEDTEVLVSLVRHHLLLPDVATRRDLDDPGVIARVADDVGSLLVLDLLLALTEADAQATGPAAWSAWKADLVAALGDRVARVLRGSEAVGTTGCPSFPDEEVRELLRRRATSVRASGDTLTVVAPDRPGLLSRVAGMLALKGVPVRAADATSTDDGMAASRFHVDAGDGLDWEDVVPGVRRAVEGRLAVEARLAERARARRSTAAPKLSSVVRVDNHASETETVLEVRVPDRIGTLYRVTRALADLDLDIRMARVTTLGHEVIDTFYVRTVTGGKLTDPADIRELERAVLHQVSLA